MTTTTTNPTPAAGTAAAVAIEPKTHKPSSPSKDGSVMKVICDRAALVEVLNLVAGVVPARTPKPVLLCLKLTAADGTLTIAGTDQEVGLKLSTDKVEISKPGEALIPADKLAQICRESADATLTIDVKDEVCNVRGADSKFTIYGHAPSDFPPIPDGAAGAGGKGPDFHIDAGQLHSLIERTRFAAARENSRYAINGVLMKRRGRKLEFVATDGRRLALARGSCTSAAEGESHCIIPGKALALLVRLATVPDAPVAVFVSETQIVFAVGEPGSQAILASNVVEGTFPPYEDVIPKDLDKKVVFDVNTLASAVRRAALLTNEESKAVRLAFSGKKLTITSRAPETGEAEISVPLTTYDGGDIEIGFNPTFITDVLKTLPATEVTLELKAGNKPAMVRAGSDFLYVLMPVSLN